MREREKGYIVERESYLVRRKNGRETAYEKALVRRKEGKGYKERETNRYTASLCL